MGMKKISHKNRTARKFLACGPPGGLFGFDHEVVTLSIPCVRLLGDSSHFVELRVPGVT